MKKRLIVAVGIIAALSSLWLKYSLNKSRKYQQSSPEQTERSGATRAVADPVSTPQKKLTSQPRSKSLGTTNARGSKVIDQNTALSSLRRWIARREGHDVEVVSAFGIHDLNGRLISMNVLITTNLGGGLTGQKLRERLDTIAIAEGSVREKLHKAYQDGDIEQVNQLVSAMSAMRANLIESNAVSSYKISLSKDRPPVLAFWPGLPFETVREGAAWNLASTKLGSNLTFQGLVHYSSATALLSFANAAGGIVYIDPFRMEEVPLAILQSPRAPIPRPDDDGRGVRIAAQWTDFLEK